ncbi:hypothetical protein MMPV_004393 [Pyropia vietnamensis]
MAPMVGGRSPPPPPPAASAFAATQTLPISHCGLPRLRRRAAAPAASRHHPWRPLTGVPPPSPSPPPPPPPLLASPRTPAPPYASAAPRGAEGPRRAAVPPSARGSPDPSGGRPPQPPAAAAVAGVLLAAALTLAPVPGGGGMGRPPPVAAGVVSENTLARRYVVTDGSALLRYALPLPAERYAPVAGFTTGPAPTGMGAVVSTMMSGGTSSGTASVPAPAVRRLQAALEALGVDLRARGKASVTSARADLLRVADILSAGGRVEMLLDVPRPRRPAAAALLSELDRVLASLLDELGLQDVMSALVSAGSGGGGGADPALVTAMRRGFVIATSGGPSAKQVAWDRVTVQNLRLRALEIVGELEELMVPARFPYSIPRKYAALPRLLGRATLQVTVAKPANGDAVFRSIEGDSLGRTATFTAVLDGYSAPLSAGAVVDLALRGFYDGTPVSSREKGYYWLAGDPDGPRGPATGYIDPATGVNRRVPFEVLIDGDSAPTWGRTMETAGVGDLQPVLPMTAYGALALAHGSDDENDASSAFYCFLLDPRSTAARSVGGTVLNGNIATFGYFVGADPAALAGVAPGDTIVKVEVMRGEDAFFPNAAAAAAAAEKQREGGGGGGTSSSSSSSSVPAPAPVVR